MPAPERAPGNMWQAFKRVERRADRLAGQPRRCQHAFRRPAAPGTAAQARAAQGRRCYERVILYKPGFNEIIEAKPQETR